MDDLLTYYFATCAAAYVRGTLSPDALASAHDRRLLTGDLSQLAASELEQVIRLGLGAGLRLHRFKRTMGLARVARVLGILKGLAPATLLDIGSGRGAFLWPLLDAFPELSVTMVDQDPRRVTDAQAVCRGGLRQHRALQMDATDLAFATDTFDVVTMLEVLEHIPEAPRALSEAVRVARRAVVLSVPSKEDDNPQHIHLFTQEAIRDLYQRAGAANVRFEYVLNHLIAVARVKARQQ